MRRIVLVAAAVIVAGMNPAAAAPTTSAAEPVTGYQQAQSGVVTDPAGARTTAAVMCPAGTRVLGGGGVVFSDQLTENLAVSRPLDDQRTWTVTATNASDTDGTFQVYAVCASRPAAYDVVHRRAAVAARSQGSATVVCPSGTVPLGGGGVADSASTAVNLASSTPTASGWRITVSNVSGQPAAAVAYAVCAKRPLGYQRVVGDAVAVAPGTQDTAVVTCPRGTLVLGGGASSSRSPAVGLNTTVPDGVTDWRSYVNNGSTRPTTVTPYAVCARTAA